MSQNGTKNIIISKKLKSMVKKTGDKVIKKTIKDKIVDKYMYKISNMEQDYEEIIESEQVERSIRKAEMEVVKA